MTAIQLVTTETDLAFRATTLPDPIPEPEGVVLRVEAVGVTQTELAWYPTSHHKDGTPRLNAIPGHEFSGVVVATGAQQHTFQIGDAVYGMNDWFEDGATAELCRANPAGLALKPPSLSHEQAASVPIAALTAWQGLVSKAHLRPGQRVLVHGGAGSVGGFAIQIAVLHGAHVVTTAGKEAFAYVTGLGAAECIDYQHERFEDRITPVDIVFDTVGGATLARSWQVLNASGCMVTIASDAESSADPRVKDAFFIVDPNGDQLASISGLLETGKLRTSVKASLPFTEAEQAYKGKAFPGFGKIVLHLHA